MANYPEGSGFGDNVLRSDHMTSGTINMRPNVGALLKSQQEQLMKLRETVSQLSDRIDPVLSDPSDQKLPDESTYEAGGSAISRQIAENTSLIVALQRQVISLTTRVEL